MKQSIQSHQSQVFNNSIELLLNKSRTWESEIRFINLEQKFLNKLLSQHILTYCKSVNYKKAKLFLKGLQQEAKLGIELTKNIQEHSINLSLLIENIYLKREDFFRNNHKYLKNEVINYIENFKYLKEQIFDLVLVVMQKQKLNNFKQNIET